MKQLLKIKIQIVYIAFVLLAMVTVFIGCSKEKQILTDSTWVVESMKINADSFLENPPNGVNLTLSFLLVKSGYSFIFILEEGVMMGHITIRNNKIDFGDVLSLQEHELYKNSQFTKSCAQLLGKVNRYETDGYDLILTGKKGEIINLTRKIEGVN